MNALRLRVIDSAVHGPEWEDRPMMELQDITKVYKQGRRSVHALRGICFHHGPQRLGKIDIDAFARAFGHAD